jgi:hypothetical protein
MEINCSRLALGAKCERVGDCREDALPVDSNRTLFEVIPLIVERGYVLVSNQQDKRITGIVTASDLSLEFQTRSEPFLLLREVELHVRQILGEKLTAADFDLLGAVTATTHKPQNVADLTFDEYVRLFQHPQIWPKLDPKIDSTVLTSPLEEIRIIRNDVMHFDPDPMTPDELGTIKRGVRLMQELYEVQP